MTKYYFLCQGWISEEILSMLFSKISESSDIFTCVRVCSLNLLVGSNSGGRYFLTRSFSTNNVDPRTFSQQFARKLFELCQTDKFLEDMISHGGDIELHEQYSVNFWHICSRNEFAQFNREMLS